MDLKQFLEQTKGKKKFTVILGSGIHSQVNQNSILSSWDKLLSIIFKNDDRPEYKIPETIQFENALSKFSSKYQKLTASEVEKKLNINIAEIVKSESINIDSSSYKHLSFLNSTKISDVISLNFDLTAELYFAKGKIRKAKYLKHQNKKLESTRHRYINNINFWHPHGDFYTPSSLQLGFRRYNLLSKEIEILRQKFKADEKIIMEKRTNSWVSAIIQNPVIILGSSLSYSELGLWLTFINRERNFLKGKNLKYKEPIFILSEGDSHIHIPKEFYFPIVSYSQTFEEGWNEINNLLK